MLIAYINLNVLGYVTLKVAAGNSGAGDAPRTVGSPATGKNVIAGQLLSTVSTHSC